jgi:hypothetical protein
MRYSLFASLLVLAMACSTEPTPNPTPDETTKPPTTASATLWFGSESCQAGRVEGRLEMFANRGLGQPLPTSYLLRISLDGDLHATVSAPRIRVAGVELPRGSATEASRVEVFAGFSGTCEWISLTRTQ